MTAATRHRVLEIIDGMGYVPSSFARILAGRTVPRLGLVIGGEPTPGAERTLHGFETAARRRGYRVVVSAAAQGSPGRALRDEVAHVRDSGVDGLCVLAPREQHVPDISAMTGNVPTVVVASRSVTGVPTVGADHRAVALLAVQHLLDLGHRHIQVVSSHPARTASDIHAQVTRAALARAGVRARPVVVGEPTSDFGFVVGADAALLRGVTALIASSTAVALGLIHGLASRGIRVPHDVSVVACEETADAAHFAPALTTLAADDSLVGERAATHLLALVDGGEAPPSLWVPPQVVQRRSAAPPRRG